MSDYLALPAVPAVSGSWMVDPDLLAQRRWDEVVKRSGAAIAIAHRALRNQELAGTGLACSS
jgi:2-dehydro-3-deoxyphosphogluconate aldolase/(4S)-4-hydroxy-2-oxoglutarate aldolase